MVDTIVILVLCITSGVFGWNLRSFWGEIRHGR
jgi:hypothetical protein